jgi:hypothetical protein
VTDADFGGTVSGYFRAGDRISAHVQLPSGAPAHLTKVTGRDAGDLGDLSSIINDLERVVALCDRLDAGDLDDLASSAVWEAAVVAYGRCVLRGKTSQGKGERRKIPSDVLAARSPALLAQHQKVKAEYRGEHVGHRVGPGEQMLIEAIREAEGQPAIGVHVTTVRLMRPTDHGDLRALAEDLLSRLRPLFDRERDALVRKLNQS